MRGKDRRGGRHLFLEKYRDLRQELEKRGHEYRRRGERVEKRADIDCQSGRHDVG